MEDSEELGISTTPEVCQLRPWSLPEFGVHHDLSGSIWSLRTRDAKFLTPQNFTTPNIIICERRYVFQTLPFLLIHLNFQKMNIENAFHHFWYLSKSSFFLFVWKFQGSTKKSKVTRSPKKTKWPRLKKAKWPGVKNDKGQGSKWQGASGVQQKKQVPGSPKIPPGPGDEISQKILELARPSLREGVNIWGNVGEMWGRFPGGWGMKRRDMTLFWHQTETRLALQPAHPAENKNTQSI